MCCPGVLTLAGISSLAEAVLPGTFRESEVRHLDARPGWTVFSSTNPSASSRLEHTGRQTSLNMPLMDGTRQDHPVWRVVVLARLQVEMAMRSRGTCPTISTIRIGDLRWLDCHCSRCQRKHQQCRNNEKLDRSPHNYPFLLRPE